MRIYFQLKTTDRVSTRLLLLYTISDYEVNMSNGPTTHSVASIRYVQFTTKNPRFD